MKLTCHRKEFAQALAVTGRAVSPKSTLPILQNLLIEVGAEGARLVGTDLEIGLDYRLAARVEPGPPLCLPARTLAEIVGALPDTEMTLTAQDGAGEITCGRSRTKLLGLNPEEFPPLPEVGRERGFTLPERDLARLLRGVIPAASKDTTRPILTAVETRLEAGRLHLCATDTHRLHTRAAFLSDSLGEGTALVPGRALEEAVRFLDADCDEPVAVQMDANQIAIRAGRWALTSRLIEGTFPRWARLVPTSWTTRALLDAAGLRAAIKRADVVARENSHRLHLVLAAGTLTLSAQAGSLGRAEETLEVEQEGADLALVVNSDYLLEAVTAAEAETVVWTGTGPLTPFLLRAADGPEGEFALIIGMNPEGGEQ